MIIISEIASLLTTYGVSQQWSEMTSRLILLVLSFIAAWLLHVIAQGPLLKGMEKVVAVTKKMEWEDILLKKKVFHRLADFVPVLALYILVPKILHGTPLHSLGYVIMSLMIVVFLNNYCRFFSKRCSRYLSIVSILKKYINHPIYSDC